VRGLRGSPGKYGRLIRTHTRKTSIASEIVERVELDTEVYAVILGGPEHRSLFTCGSDSHDPAEIALAPSATLRVVEVEVPGAGLP
jgi:hypothetical protein